VPSKPIVVVGSINLDLVCKAERIPVAGETITGSSFQTFHGGKGANQAVAVARLAYPVSMIAKVGDDSFGRQLRGALKSAGVDTRAVTIARRTASGVALVSTDRQGQNSIVVIPGANGQLRPGDVQRALPLLRSAAMILMQLEIPMDTIECLARVACRYRVPLMLDPAPARELSRELLRKVDYLTPNETETCILSGLASGSLELANVRELAGNLQMRGARHVIIKMGAQGVYLSGPHGCAKFLPAFSVSPVDTTAAGDAFNGGLAVALTQGKGLEEAAKFASAVAAISVTRMGAQPSMPTLQEVNNLLKRSPSAVEVTITSPMRAAL
jgi:ribokinase